MLYFHRWGWWILAAVLRIGLFACLITMEWVGIIGDAGATAVGYLYPEDYFLLVLSWFTGGKAHAMSGETLDVVVFLDTLAVGYLLEVTLNVRKLRRYNKSTTD